MNKIEVRKAVVNDLQELGELFDGYRVFYSKPSDIESAKIFLHERIIKNESVIFVSVAGIAITGFAQLYPLFSSTRMKKLWLLNDLFVDEKFRGHGFSVALIERAKQLCEESGACGFMLETAKTNKAGNQLYKKLGLCLDTEHNIYNWETNNDDHTKSTDNSASAFVL